MSAYDRSKEVSSLGSGSTNYQDEYAPGILETFQNVHPDNDYLVNLDCFEFSSKCPKTGQPDWAKIEISYIPNVDMVESKSLKLYLFSFRNHGDFHEDCINKIMEDLRDLMNPKYIEVMGLFSSRGGIAILPFANWSNPEFDYADFKRQRMLDVMNLSSQRKLRYDG